MPLARTYTFKTWPWRNWSVRRCWVPPWELCADRQRQGYGGHGGLGGSIVMGVAPKITWIFRVKMGYPHLMGNFQKSDLKFQIVFLFLLSHDEFVLQILGIYHSDDEPVDLGGHNFQTQPCGFHGYWFLFRPCCDDSISEFQSWCLVFFLSCQIC